MHEKLKVIQKYYPTFTYEQVEYLDHGMNNDIYVLDHQYVFRFPKTEINRATLEREVQCLALLKDHVSFNVPVFEYVNIGRLEETFVGYKKLPGEMLTKARFHQLNPEKLGHQLAMILKELHQPKLVDLMKPFVQEVDDYELWKDMYERIESQLFKFMSVEKQQIITKDFNEILNALSGKGFERAFVHNDFGPTNILVDDDSNVTGIIDFGMIAIGDKANDIACMIGPFGYGASFIKDYFDMYPEAVEMLERAKLYTKSFALQDALYGIEHDDQEAFDFGMKDYLEK